MSSPTIRFNVVTDHRLVEDAKGVVAGVFVATTDPQPVGEDVSMKVELPWGETVDLHGHVEWVVDEAAATLRKRQGMGIVCELQAWQVQLLDRLRLHHAPLKLPVRTKA